MKRMREKGGWFDPFSTNPAAEFLWNSFLKKSFTNYILDHIIFVILDKERRMPEINLS
jgi:hypothetical protein